MLLMLISAPPLFVRVATLGPPAFPTATWPQVIEVGETPAEPEPPPDAPEPLRATESGVPELLLETVQAAARAPEVVGVKRMFVVQLADAGKLDPQVVEEMAKSPAFAPEMDEALRVTELVVLLVTVTLCVPLEEPTAMLPNDRLEGDAVTLPEEPPEPRPDTVTCCGLLEALSENVRFAVRVPEVVGLNRIVTVQLAEAARVVPQVC